MTMMFDDCLQESCHTVRSCYIVLNKEKGRKGKMGSEAMKQEKLDLADATAIQSSQCTLHSHGLLTMMLHRLAMICARLHDSPMPTVRCVCVNYNCLSVIGGVCSGLSCQLGGFSSMMSKVFEWAAQEFCGPVAHWRTSKK